MHTTRQKYLMTPDEYWKYATSTETTDLNRAQAALLKIIGGDTSAVQFIYCGSPQTALCIIRLVSEMHETSTPPRPRKIQGHQGHQGHLISFDEASTTVSKGSRPAIWPSFTTLPPVARADIHTTRIVNIREHLNRSLKFNIKLNMYEDGEDSSLIDVALQNISPDIGNIHIAQESMSRPLQLERLLYGQYSLYEEVSTDPLLLEVFKSCGWVWIYKHHIFISARPDVLSLNGERLLHSERGAALQYPDGFQVHAINGVRVPKYIVEEPSKITRWRINKEANVEIRRIMMERYKLGEEVHGIGAYVRDSKAQRLDHDEVKGTLWRLENGDILSDRWISREVEDIVMLEVVNSTPESDGHFKRYWLRVPPNMQSSAQAAAWTFGLQADEYDPEVET